VPPVVVALFVFIAGVEGLFSLAERGLVGGPQSVGWRLQAAQDYAFSGEIFDWMLTNGVWPVEHVIRLVAYPFVHGSFTHALFACVMLLALGKMVAEVMGDWRTLAIFVVSGIGGAVGFALALDDPTPLIGAFPPVYGLIGAFTYLLWLRLGQMGEQQIRAFGLIGVLLLLQLIFGVFFQGGRDWVADVSAFATGFALAVVLTPGGFADILARLRQR
jgi:membrane associated rhomboid family serine protease